MKSGKKTFIVIGCIILCVILLALFIALLVSQVFFTISATPANAECTTWDATYVSLTSLVTRYESGTMTDDELAYSFNGELPSDDPADYMDIYCYFDVTNKSRLDRYTLDATLKNADKYSKNILFVTDAKGAYTVPLFQNQTKQAYIILHVYIGDLTEEQICELIGGLTVTVTADGKYFGKRVTDVSFDICDDISFEVQ